MTRCPTILVTIVLLAYFVFTSGLIYELTGSEVTNSVVVPYSLALSGERTGLVGLFTADDQRCAAWVAESSLATQPIVCDGNIGLLLRSYNFSRIEQMTYFTGAFNAKPHYLFFSTWNIENNKILVGATSAGLRDLDLLPKIDTTLYYTIFESGKSIIYMRKLN